MALYFLNMQTFSRSEGSSAPSLAAYRSGERIRDARTGRTYDHTERRGVMHKEILLPSGFAAAEVGWAANRPSLWNAAEAAEHRKNSRVAREYLIALPSELTHPQRVNVVRAFAQDLADRYGFAVDAVVHAPRNFRGSDPRNFHAHLLATTREVSREGLGKKTTLDLNDESRRRLGLGRGVEELFFTRQRWAEVANAALASAYVGARIDHRSLEARGITREPKLWIPRVAYEIERRGGHSFVAERIRESHRARLESQRAPPDSRSPELGRNRAHIEEMAARQSAKKWAAQYGRETLPTTEDWARKWLQYQQDKETLGAARAAEIHLKRTPAAGHDRGYDFGL